MNWHLLDYSSNSGRFNMDFDLQLVKNCKENEAYLRFYGWNPSCISLGANQSYSDIDQTLTSANNIDVVKRPTGGRAILHSEELTYSVVVKKSNKISGREYYEYISNAIVIGLKLFNSKLKEVVLENLQPNFPQLLNSPSGSLCFASTAKSEIKFKGKKLVGSAQRKLGNTLLQHGSILIGKNHISLVQYLNIDESQKKILKEEIENKTTELESITNSKVYIDELQRCIIIGFNEVFKSTIPIEESAVSSS